MLEGLLGMAASVIAILTAGVFLVRFLVRRFDKWAESVVENTGAMRELSERVSKLEMRFRN